MLRGGECLGGHAEGRWPPRLDLAEHEPIPIPADEIELAAAEPDITSQDEVAPRRERPCGVRLGGGAGGATIHTGSHRMRAASTQTRPLIAAAFCASTARKGYFSSGLLLPELNSHDAVLAALAVPDAKLSKEEWLGPPAAKLGGGVMDVAADRLRGLGVERDLAPQRRSLVLFAHHDMSAEPPDRPRLREGLRSS